MPAVRASRMHTLRLSSLAAGPVTVSDRSVQAPPGGIGSTTTLEEEPAQARKAVHDRNEKACCFFTGLQNHDWAGPCSDRPHEPRGIAGGETAGRQLTSTVSSPGARR